MREPSFWWHRPGLAAGLLAPIGACYGAVAARRMAQPGARAGIPVICVGNFTLGGSGKTPAATAVARLLLAAGEKPFFLSRGYGGRLAGPLQVDSTVHTAADVGDEPLLLAHAAPTIVARDRVAGAQAARAAGAAIIVMDDGMQNPSLAKDVSIAVVDGRRGIGNGRVFPAGPLRAPFAAQLDRVNAMLVVGDDSGATPVIETAAARGLPVLHGRLVPDAAAIASLRGKKALAFAGIGDPQKFFATLAAAGISAPVQRGFADHHRYSTEDAASLLVQAEHEGLELLTTEKDHARMTGDPALSALAARVRTLPVTLVIDKEDELRALLRAKS